jgi:hypothetical protein
MILVAHYGLEADLFTAVQELADAIWCGAPHCSVLVWRRLRTSALITALITAVLPAVNNRGQGRCRVRPGKDGRVSAFWCQVVQPFTTHCSPWRSPSDRPVQPGTGHPRNLRGDSGPSGSGHWQGSIDDRENTANRTATLESCEPALPTRSRNTAPPKQNIRDFVERGLRFEDALDAGCPPDSVVESLATAMRR